MPIHISNKILKYIFKELPEYILYIWNIQKIIFWKKKKSKIFDGLQKNYPFTKNYQLGHLPKIPMVTIYLFIFFSQKLYIKWKDKNRYEYQ